VLGVGASVVYHAVLGVALALLVWGAGLGALRLLRRLAETPRSLLDAYPLGLLAIMLASVPPLLHPALWPLSLAGVGVLVWFAARGGRSPVTPGRYVLPLAGGAAFGIGLGALLHGPTDEFDSAAYGGMLFYVDKVVAATRSIAPFHDLLAEGEEIIYAEAGTSFVGAAMSVLPGFDAVLYNAATLPAFAVASLGIGLATFTADREPIGGRFTPVAVALLAVAIIVYPTWMTETPPAAFALPLAFPLYRIWRGALSPGWLALLSVVVGLDYLFTKVLGVVPLGLLLLAGLVERLRPRADFRRLLVIGIALLAAAAAALVGLLFLTAGWYATLLEAKALPLDVARSFADGDFNPRVLGLACAMAGEILLLVALARARFYALFVCVGLLVPITWFVAGYAFDIALGTVIFVVALEMRERGSPDGTLVLAAAALLAMSVALRDVLGARPGLALSVIVLLTLLPSVVRAHQLVPYAWAGALVALLFALADVAAAGLVTLLVLAAIAFVRPDTRLLRGAVGVAAIAAVAAAVVSLRERTFDIGSPTVTLTPSDYDIWHTVRSRVPPDGIVFTSLTGLEVTPHRGWNNYPSVAGRQLFIAGWYDGRLVAAPEDRDRRLELNAEVLDGRRRPPGAELSRTFGSYYAVTEREDDVPPSFQQVYANDRYALYEIP
jgi:hypothetical protein